MYAFSSAPASSPAVHALLMSDCANVISSLSQGNPRNDEKCLRLVHAYLKDFLKFMNISYCSALFNLSDVGAKAAAANLQIWRKLLRTGTFAIGCLSREECLAISSQVRAGGHARGSSVPVPSPKDKASAL